MKLAFSTKGWHDRTFDEFCDIAADMNYEGVELHNINNEMFRDKDGGFLRLRGRRDAASSL